MGEDEATLFDFLLELVIGLDGAGHRLAHGLRLLKEVLLNVIEHLLNGVFDSFEREHALLVGISSEHLDCAVLKVAETESEADGNTLDLIIGKFETGTFVVGVVELDADSALTKLLDDGLNLFGDLLEALLVLVDRNDHNLKRREFRRKNETVVVRVGHDERTHKTGRHTP